LLARLSIFHVQRLTPHLLIWLVFFSVTYITYQRTLSLSDRSSGIA